MIPYKDLNTTRTIPVVTILLIIANAALFLYEAFLPESAATRLVYRYAVIPLEFKIGGNLPFSPGPFPLLSVFSALFLHGGWLHLISNMLYLWIFGDNVEERMGPVRFLVFYLFCGVVATFAQVTANFDSKIPSLGASGAIAGILGAYFRLFPRAKIAVLVPLFYFFRTVILPAWLVIGLWILMQVLSLRMSPVSNTGGIAYFAHVGGFLAGLFFMSLFIRKGRRSRP